MTNTGTSTIDIQHDATGGANEASGDTGPNEDRERERREGLRRALADVGAFGEAVLRMPLRPYQLDVARAVARSVAERQGLTFTVMMSRQSGKNQLSAHLEALLLTRHQRAGGSLIKRPNSPPI